MHELGIVYEVIKVVETFAEANKLVEVSKIVLEIGQLSQAVPRFIKECYPAAVDGTRFENTDLEIILVPAIGCCKGCGVEYNIITHQKTCPECHGQTFELISGKEFSIKEVLAY